MAGLGREAVRKAEGAGSMVFTLKLNLVGVKVLLLKVTRPGNGTEGFPGFPVSTQSPA